MSNSYPVGYTLQPKVSLAGMTETDIHNFTKDYICELERYFSEYAEKLQKAENIVHRTTFQCALKYAGLKAGRPDYKCDYLMSSVYHWFVDMCGFYQQNITFEKFCVLIQCSYEYYSIFLKDGAKSGLTDRITFRNEVKTDVISSMQEGALTGNPGYMFVLKARFGWSDQPQVNPVRTETGGPSLEQIAASIGIQAAAEPACIPDLSEPNTDDIIDV